MSLADQVKALRQFYEEGNTRSYSFRREQLNKLAAALTRYEQEIYDALYADLRKSKEESWATEIGLIQSEIRHSLRNLKRWLTPRAVSTNLVNLPSTSEIRFEPKGVVLIIGPWNYPFLLLLSPLVAAMAAGNCVILKAPEQAPASSRLMHRIISETFNNQYILLLEGDGRNMVPSLILENRIDHVFFTGSTEVGRIIYRYAAEKLIPMTLELGGKSPCVITKKANITLSAKRIVLAKFSNAGQMCVAPDYILVHEDVREPFIETCIRFIRQFYGQDAAISPDFGRIINRAHADRLERMLQGEKILYGGHTDPGQLFIEPTLVEPVSHQSAVMQEEIFGPILPILSFKDDQEARKIIHLHPDPLAFYVFTDSRQEADDWLDAVPAGGSCVNNVSWHLTNPHLPFGGRGNSGMGAYHGQFGFEQFSHRKSVLRTPTWFDPFIKYPPFAGRLKLFKWLIR